MPLIGLTGSPSSLSTESWILTIGTLLERLDGIASSLGIRPSQIFLFRLKFKYILTMIELLTYDSSIF